MPANTTGSQSGEMVSGTDLGSTRSPKAGEARQISIPTEAKRTFDNVFIVFLGFPNFSNADYDAPVLK